MELKDLPGGDNFRNPAAGITQVAEMHGLTLAAEYAEGLKALIDPMGAKITFLHLVFSGTEPKGIEGAGR